jgi:ribosomal protein S4
MLWSRVNSFDPKRKKSNWRLYRKFLLRKKLPTFVFKFRSFFKVKGILFNFYKHYYTLKSTRIIKSYYKDCLKQSSDKVYNFFNLLFFRIHLVLVYCHFTWTRVKAIAVIKGGMVSINSKIIKKPNTVLTCGDILYFHSSRNTLCLSAYFQVWKKLRKKRRKSKNKFRFKFLRRLWIKNFFELSFLVRVLVYVRPLLNNELFRRKVHYPSKSNRFNPRLKKKRFIVYNTFKFKLLKKFWSFN